MANSSPPWAAYRALMACCVVALDNRPGVRPVGIGETLRRALAKLAMRAAGDQAKTACGDLQLCAGLKAGIEGATHAMGQRRVKRERTRRLETEEEAAVEAEEQEEESVEVAGLMINLIIETAGMEEEAAEGLAAAIGMELEEDRESEGEEGVGGTQWALEALEFLTQEADPSGTMLVDTRNGFNKLSRLSMLWTVQHRWPAGARFAINCYKHWATSTPLDGGVASHNPE